MARKPRTRIILVDPKDKQIGIIEKILGHKHGMLHRAFSVFIFRKQQDQLELLLQQRSANKYHGGRLWTNTCCSHPRPNEEIKMAAQQRLQEEMGLHIKLKKAGKFHYFADMGNGLAENEIDHVFVGSYTGENIKMQPQEADNFKWMKVSELKKELKQHPQRYTPWLQQALQLALKVKLIFREAQ